MPVLPIPMIIALLLSGLLLHRVLARDSHITLLALIACCALQSAIMALVHYYGLTGLRVVQPVLATVIPAMVWLAFRRIVAGRLCKRDFYFPMMGPVIASICLVIRPEALDGLIPVLFAVYGMSIAATLMQGEDGLPHSRLGNGRITILVWHVLAIALLASAAGDIFISIRLASGDAGVLLWLPSLFACVTLLALGALGLLHAMESQGSKEERAPYSAEDKARDSAVFEEIEAYVTAQKPYLDPDLTLARLARRLHMPQKRLSGAINSRTGENLSRYINRHRIHHACVLLQNGQSVTEAMLASGFNTKSNFNREFLRVMGKNPRLWLQSIH